MRPATLHSVPFASRQGPGRHHALPIVGLCLWLAGAFAQTALGQSRVSWDPAAPTGTPDRILGLAADPRNNSLLYVAAPGGGVWKTQDGGDSWVPLLDSASSVQVCSLALDPRFPDVLYAGTGDDQSPRPAQGVKRSADGGRTWTVDVRFTNQPVCTLAVDPVNSGQIFASSAEGLFLSPDAGATWSRILAAPATSVAFDGQGSVYAGFRDGTIENALLRSSDGGRTWTNLILPPNPNPAAAASAPDWVSVVAGRGAVSVVVSHSPSGLPLSSTLDFYRSTDAGNSWSATFGIGRAVPPVSLLTDPSTGNLYVTGTTVLTSEDEGFNWRTIPTLTRRFHTAAFTNETLLLGGEEGLEPVALVQGAVPRWPVQLRAGRFLGVSFDSGNRVWGAGPGGLFGPLPATAVVEQDSIAVTFTGSWTAESNSAASGGSTARAAGAGARANLTFTGTGVTWVGLTNSSSGFANVYVDEVLKGQFDTYSAQETAQVKVYSVTGLRFGRHTLTVEMTGLKSGQSSGAGVRVDAFEIISEGVPGTGAVGNVATASSASGAVFAAGNAVIHRSTDGVRFSSGSVLGVELRAPFPPLAIDPESASSAYVAGRRLYYTTDSGANWTAKPIVDPDTSRVVIALAIAPASPLTLYAATACLPEVVLAPCAPASQIWRSTDGGDTWVTMSPLPGLVNQMAVDPRQTDTVYAAIGAFPAGPSLHAGFLPGELLRSTDGGAAWVSIRGNLPRTPINAIAIDPNSLPTQVTLPAPKLYVGTDAGVFASFNGGGQWTNIGRGTASCIPLFCISGSDGNLPPSPVTDLAFRQPGNMLVAATFGRGIYKASTTTFTPSLIANPLSVDVTLAQEGTMATGVALTNLTTATIDWQLNALNSWISVAEPAGTLGPGGTIQVTIRISAVGLGVGTSQGLLQLVSGPLWQNILVKADVTASPAQMTIVSGNNANGAPGSRLPPMQVLITDSNQLPLPGVPVNFTIASGGGSLGAQSAVTNASGIAGVVLTLPSNPGTVRVSVSSGNLSVTFTANAIPAPALLADSVRNGVTFNSYTPLGPGSVISISGQNLAQAPAIAEISSLPTTLQTTRVLISAGAGDISLPLFSVSAREIRALLPPNIPQGSYRLRVEVGPARSNEVQISIAAFDPGIFTVNQSSRGQGVFIKDDGSVVTVANPAERGARVTLYAAGLGAVSPAIEAGAAGAAAEPLNRTVRTPRVFFDIYQAEVIYSGLVPGIAGRYQVTVRVPALVSPATNISVSLTIGGFGSNRVTIPVR